MTISILKYILFFGISGVLVLIDQWTKHLAYINLYNKEPIVIIDKVLELVYVL